MARSPDYLRLATNATRTLAETAFDGLREAVLVVDVRAKHLPVVLANQAARECLTPADAAGLADSSLYGFLGAASASVIESATASLSDTKPAVTQPLTWRPHGRRVRLLDRAQAPGFFAESAACDVHVQPEASPVSTSDRRLTSCPWTS